MTQQTINLGVDPNGVGGDTERAAFNKCNLNFNELYAGIAKAVIETGSNSVGSWVKFSDGTMIQSFAPWTTPTIGANAYNAFEVKLPTTCTGAASSAVVISAIPSQSNDHYGVTSSQVNSTTKIYFTIRNGAAAQTFSMRCNVLTRWK